MASIGSFEAARPRLVSIAYRMLGSSADAEDVVQEAWLRWQGVDEAVVATPEAWLSTTVTRLCLDRLKALRVRREAYQGPWLPEPVASEQPLDRESISLAFLLVLERLSPSERAVYLLHQVFDYTHREVAEALGMTEAAVRQQFHRAQAHVADNRPRFAPSPEQHRRLLSAFASALMAGDLQGLTTLLANDASLCADGGGKVRGAATRPVLGRDNVARFLQGLVQKFSVPNLRHDVQTVNGWPALIIRVDGQVTAVMNIETDGQQIIAVRSVVNPEKLALPEVN